VSKAASVLLALGVFLICGCESPGDRAHDRPNLLLVLVDDLGWQDTSVPMGNEPTALNRRWRTPHVEALAARGVRFANGYASAPVCTPTRTSILTGLAPARTGITYWTLHEGRDTSRGREDLRPPAWTLNGLQPGDSPTLPGLLRGAGYRTIHVGKAHLGAVGTPGADPTNLGFDVNIAGHGAGAPGSFYGRHHFASAGRQGKDPASNPNVWDVPGLEAYHGEDVYLTEALTTEACRALREAVEGDRPFFMHFAPYAVHTPIMANERFARDYPDMDERERAYATMIASVDGAVGELVRTLGELGELDNTVIVFTGDNGGLSAHARGVSPTGETKHTHNLPARSGKGSAYDGGTRVPWVVAWPGVTDGRAGTLDRTPVVSHDLMPTLLSAAGVEPPGGLDGRDLTGLIAGEESGLSDRVIGWHQPHQWGAAGPGIEPFTAVRRGRWKLIMFHAGPRFELYDVEAEPGEEHDLSSREPGVLAEMVGVLGAWIDETGADLSVVVETGEAVGLPPRSE